MKIVFVIAEMVAFGIAIALLTTTSEGKLSIDDLWGLYKNIGANLSLIIVTGVVVIGATSSIDTGRFSNLERVSTTSVLVGSVVLVALNPVGLNRLTGIVCIVIYAIATLLVLFVMGRTTLLKCFITSHRI